LTPDVASFWAKLKPFVNQLKRAADADGKEGGWQKPI